MKPKIRKIIGIIVIILIIVIPLAKHGYENSHVKFTDETLGKVISGWAKGVDITPDNITYEEIGTVKELDIGFSGSYKTIKDIQHCRNVEELYINTPVEQRGIRSFIELDGTERKMSEKELAVLQRELAEILPHLSELKRLYIGELGGNHLTSIDFLKNCTQIKKVWLEGVKATDFSVLKTCTSLEEINIYRSAITNADDLADLKNVKQIILYQTPLAENEKEVKKLHKMYPDAQIKTKQVIFSDSTMGEVLCNMLNVGITTENVMYSDLRNIDKLNIGYSGYYDTIKDIQECWGLKELYVNTEFTKECPAYSINEGKINKKLTEEEIKILQQELAEILPRLNKLEKLELSNSGGQNWLSIDFLKDCNWIAELYLNGCDATEYSVLKTCTSLKHLELTNAKIFKAEDIIGLPRLEVIKISNTPLAENKQEIEKLKEAYPDVDIYY